MEDFICNRTLVRILEFLQHVGHVLVKELAEWVGRNPSHNIEDGRECMVHSSGLDAVVRVVNKGCFDFR